MIYNKWKFNNLIPHPIEYSGHGFRYQEPLAHCLEDMVRDTAVQIQQVLPQGGSDFILFGHSMGGLIAWLTAQRLRPSALYVSACEPPGILDVRRYRQYESEDVLMRYIRDYKRLSEKRMESKVFQNELLPIIRNDYLILSEYKYTEIRHLDIPIKIFCSREDTLMRYEMMQKWLDYGSDVQICELLGDHFYIEDDGVRGTMVGFIEGVCGG